MSEISDKELESQLLQAHSKNPKDLHILNELVYFYGSRLDNAKADYYEKIFKKLVEDHLA
jgi:hypothetical protein